MEKTPDNNVWNYFHFIDIGTCIIQEGNEIQGNRKQKYINEWKTPETNSTTHHTSSQGPKDIYMNFWQKAY